MNEIEWKLPTQLNRQHVGHEVTLKWRGDTSGKRVVATGILIALQIRVDSFPNRTSDGRRDALTTRTFAILDGIDDAIEFDSFHEN